MEEKDIDAERLAVRKAQLLQMARRSRLRWVLQARETQPKDTQQSKTKEPANKPTSLRDLVNVPAAGCIQDVLDFLSQLTAADDSLSVDLDTLLLSIQDDGVDEEVENFSQEKEDGSVDWDTYEGFLRRLLLPQSAGLVCALQQFETKV